MSAQEQAVVVRDATPGDDNFILATWLRGLRHGNTFFGRIDQTIYFETYHRIIRAVLARPDTSTRVACLKDDQEVILGYAVSHPVQGGSALDWIFCKKAWRNIGIAKSLLPDNVTTVTHITALGDAILKKHKDIKFNPFVL